MIRNPLSDSRVPRPLPLPAPAPAISPELLALVEELQAKTARGWRGRLARWLRWFFRSYPHKEDLT